MWNKIQDSHDIVLMAHRNPDGDAIGSALAMALVLKNMGKRVRIIMTNIQKAFSFMPGIELIKEDVSEPYDLAIALDTSSLEIIQDRKAFDLAKDSLCIDHHNSNTRYANYNYVVDEAPATTQIIFELFRQMDVPITKEVGTCLMVGLITDTGGFRYREVTDKSFDMASYLYKIGVNIPYIYKETFGRQTMARFTLTKQAINRMEFISNHKIAFTYNTYTEYLECGGNPGDNDGIVGIGRDVEGVLISIYIYANSDDKFRISLRSNGDIDVSKVAIKFGGGGHINAAGFETTMDFSILKEKLIEEALKIL